MVNKTECQRRVVHSHLTILKMKMVQPLPWEVHLPPLFIVILVQNHPGHLPLLPKVVVVQVLLSLHMIITVRGKGLQYLQIVSQNLPVDLPLLQKKHSHQTLPQEM